MAPSPRAQATARGVAPVLRVVERLGLWVRPLSVLGRFVPRPSDSEASTGPRPVKTQLSRGSTPLTDAARYVVVIRDPEDVVVSSYHFVSGIAQGP